MKKEKIIVTLCIYFFLILCPFAAQKDNYVSGKITDVEGEYIYIEFDKIQGIEKGMIFGIYGPDKSPVAVCEITKFRVKNSFVAFILLQVEDVKNGYSVLSNTDEEAAFRGKIKKDKGEYFDFYKAFSASHSRGKAQQELVEDFLLYQILVQAIDFLKLDINWFKRYDLKSREPVFLSAEEKNTLDLYRGTIFEGSVFSNIEDFVFIESKINLGKLKYMLTHQGYSLKPKIIRIVFSPETQSDDIRAAREIILENSIYVSTEEINPQDVTSPISFIIYTTPEIFAEEIDAFVLEYQDISFYIYNVKGDTIEMDVSGK